MKPQEGGQLRKPVQVYHLRSAQEGMTAGTHVHIGRVLISDTVKLKW